MHDYDNDCHGCGRYDHGFEMPDVRSTLYIGEEPDDDDDRPCLKVTIRREWDRTCPECGGGDYRCLFDLTLDGVRVRTFKSDHEADRYIERAFPTARAPEPDYAWESERALRQAEGWGY